MCASLPIRKELFIITIYSQNKSVIPQKNVKDPDNLGTTIKWEEIGRQNRLAFRG